MSDSKLRWSTGALWLLLLAPILLTGELCSASCCRCVAICSDSFATCEACWAFCFAHDDVVVGFDEGGPCASAPDCDQGACCGLPDGCEMTTRLDCLIKGGSFVAGTVCSDCGMSAPVSGTAHVRAVLQTDTVSTDLSVPMRIEFGVVATEAPPCFCEDVGVPTPFTIGLDADATLIAPLQVVPHPVDGGTVTDLPGQVCFQHWLVDAEEEVTTSVFAPDLLADTQIVAVYAPESASGSTSGGTCVSWLVAGDGDDEDCVKVQWGEVEGATSYIVYRCDSENGSYSPISEPQEGVIYRDRTAQAPIVYWYRVETCASQGCILSSARDSGYAGCSCTLRPSTVKVAGNDSKATVRVDTANGCAWTAELDATWPNITSGGSGTGDGKIEIELGARSPADPPREFHVSVLDERATIMWGCYYVFSSDSVALASHSYSSVRADMSVCPLCDWEVDTDVDWIEIVHINDSGVLHQIYFSVEANPNPGQARKGHIYVIDDISGRVKGYTRCDFTVTQN